MPSAISIVIPTYNGGNFLEAALESVAAQSLLPREIIVVDDASTDGTVDVAASFASKSPVPVYILCLEKNSGSPARPINIGVAAAAGDMIAVLDQDDYYVPGALEEHARLLTSDSSLGASISWCGVKASGGHELVQNQTIVDDVLAASEAWEVNRRLSGREALRLLLKHWNFVIGYPGFVFRREMWARKGGVDERYRIGSDFDFVCWLASRGAIGLIPRIGYVRREHDSNLHRVNNLVTFGDGVRIKAEYFRKDGALRRDAALRDIISQEARVLAYHLRQSGQFSGARRFLALSLLIGGRPTASVSAILKLPAHRLWRAICKWPA